MTTSNSSNTIFKSFGIGLAILGILGVGVYGLIRLGASSNPGGGAVPPVSADDWSRGNQYAKNVLIEYSDFQCPACASYEPLVRQLMTDLNNQILFVYRHYPISELHPNAQLAAQAAEAAGKQGKFWEMHDVLFDRQNSWENDRNVAVTFTGYAKEHGLDEKKFTTDLTSDDTKKLVTTDAEGGFGAGVNATPTFFLNGKKIITPSSYAEFKDLVTNGS